MSGPAAWGEPAGTRYLTPDRIELQAAARDFAMTVVLPLADELDKVKGEFPDAFLQDLAARGYFGIMTPADYGGMGLGVFEYCIISEEIARAWMSAASIIARANGMGVGVEDPERRAELSRRQVRGEWIGAAALSEPGSGSDLASVATRAVDEGDHWALYGEKRWCGNALRADFVQVLCRTRDPEPGESRSRGLSTLLLEKERGSFPAGLTGVVIDKIGYHGFLTWNLTFDGVKVPKENVLGGRASAAASKGPESTSGAYTMAGGEGRAFKAVEQGLNVARVHTASRAVGLARAAVEDCIAYAQERVQFEHPISDFQAIRFKIAEMAAQVETCRAFYHQVAQMIDDGYPCEREAAMCKLMATEMAVRVTGDGIQVHGGNGYTTERAVERHWRDARLTTIFEGTSQIQLKIISDRLLPRSPLG
ncbi:MAG: acyl-CoA dehydrogenase [Acidimicrobiia bacterium]|nr:acyl-CoA dehydrogenase [Acidimicrobiia bacterium]